MQAPSSARMTLIRTSGPKSYVEQGFIMVRAGCGRRNDGVGIVPGFIASKHVGGLCRQQRKLSDSFNPDS